MADKVVNRRLNIYIDQGTAEQSLAALTKQEEKLTAAIERQKKAGRDATAEMNRLAATKQRIGELKDVMDGKLLPSVKMAEAAVQKLNRELKQLPANGEAAARKLQELKKAEATLETVRQKALGVNSALNGIQSSVKLGDLIKGAFLGGGLLGVAEGALSGIKAFFQGAVEEALNAEEASKRLRATLDNLGRADVFERLSAQAERFAQEVGYLDNDDVLGVFEKFIDYGKLTENQIIELTQVVIDFAAKQRIDVGTASEVVIKALEGNGKALKTYGINIKDASDVTEAYGLLMTELKPKVDGFAKSVGEDTAGQIKITRQEIADLQEDIGTKFLPAVKAFFSTVSSLVTTSRNIFRSNGVPLRTRIGALFGNAADMAVLNSVNRALDAPVVPDTPAGAGNQVLGIGGTEDKTKKVDESTQRDAQRRREQAKREREQALRDFKEVQKQIEDATAPILAAYRKINEEAEDRIKKINDALKRGLITPEQAQQALDGVERVLNEARDELNKKFRLTSGFLDNLPGVTDMDAAIEADLKENGKAMGAVVGNAIKEGVKGVLEDDSSDATDNWFQRNYDNIMFIVDSVGQLSNAFSLLGQARSNADEAALQKEMANDEKRKASQKALLDKKLISQEEYDRRIAKIDKQADDRQREIRKRQFERDKNAQTVQALIGSASAIISTLAARPGSIDILSFGAVRAIQVGLIAATTAAQIAAIRSAKPPQFEKGGFIPSGSSHAQGGISLVDNRTGARVGEVEGGEPILSRKTYARNKPLIDALMAASQSGTGMLSMNVPKLVQARQTVFENGGFIPKSGETGNSEMANTLAQLTAILQRGIQAKVLYGEYEAASDRLANIKAQSIVS